MTRISVERIAKASLFWLIVAVTKAEACAVCWGGASDSAMIDGAKMSIGFMAILIYTVLGGFIAGFVVIGRRARKAALVDGLAGSEKERPSSC
jgi:hypothetical protein